MEKEEAGGIIVAFPFIVYAIAFIAEEARIYSEGNAC